jgi:hypothetical protein
MRCNNIRDIRNIGVDWSTINILMHLSVVPKEPARGAYVSAMRAFSEAVYRVPIKVRDLVKCLEVSAEVL